jgi:hypothetical protein
MGNHNPHSICRQICDQTVPSSIPGPHVEQINGFYVIPRLKAAAGHHPIADRHGCASLLQRTFVLGAAGLDNPAFQAGTGDGLVQPVLTDREVNMHTTGRTPTAG